MRSLPVGAVSEDCHENTRWLISYWQSAGSDQGLPSRRHIDPVDFGGLLGNIWVADVQPTPRRFRYRVVGTRIVEYLGREPTGKWLDEVLPRFETTHTARDFDVIINEGVPRWRRGIPIRRGNSYVDTLERVSLPLASDGKSIDMVLNMTLFLNRNGDPV